MTREQTIIRTSIFGIVGNIILVGLKATIGIIVGSIAIVLDAVNNLTDALSSLITIIGTKISNKRPNKKHPFGYGRLEYLTSTLIGFVVLVAGGSAIFESIKALIASTKALVDAIKAFIDSKIALPPATNTTNPIKVDVKYSNLPYPNGCFLLGLLLEIFVPIIVINDDKASVKLFTASNTIAIEPTIIPIVAFNPTSIIFPTMPNIDVLIIVCSLVIESSPTYIILL